MVPDVLAGTFRSVSSPGAAKHRARWGDPRVTHSRKGSALQAVGNSRHFLESLYFPGKMIASARGGWHADEKHRTGAYSGGGTRGSQGPHRRTFTWVWPVQGYVAVSLKITDTEILQSWNLFQRIHPIHMLPLTQHQFIKALPVISERLKQLIIK